MSTVIKDEETPVGVETIFHLDDGKVAIERKADVEPILNDIQRLRQITDGKSKTGDMYHVGRIPMIIVEKYCNERGISVHDFMIDDTHVIALLNDRDYAHLRIWEGRA